MYSVLDDCINAKDMLVGEMGVIVTAVQQKNVEQILIRHALGATILGDLTQSWSNESILQWNDSTKVKLIDELVSEAYFYEDIDVELNY